MPDHGQVARKEPARGRRRRTVVRRYKPADGSAPGWTLGPTAPPASANLLDLQRLAGNRAVSGMVAQRAEGEVVQRDNKKKPAPRSPFAQSVFEQLEKRNVTAEGGALYLLNGRNPADLMAAVDQLHPHRELGLLGATGPNGFDGPRLATAFQASLSGLSADGLAALELLDAYRNYGSDTEGFWRDKVGPLSAKKLEPILRVFDRRVLDSFKRYLGDAPPAVAAKVNPLLGLLFDPPAKDIEIEFRPDQFVVDETVKYPDGKVGPAKWPMGVLIARVKGRVAAQFLARGGPWESKAGKDGHHADPFEAGYLHAGQGRTGRRAVLEVLPDQVGRRST